MASKPQFTKIVSNGKAIAIQWITRRKTASEAEEQHNHQLECPEKPRPEFDVALQAFLPFFLTILGAPTEWSENTKVTGVSLNKEEDGRRGIVITASRKCPHGAAPIALNSPHLREAKDDAKENGANFFLGGMDVAVDEICEEAQVYLDGDRAQGELFGDPPKEKKRRGESTGPELVGAVLSRADRANRSTRVRS